MAKSNGSPAPDPADGPLQGRLPDYNQVEVRYRNWYESGTWWEAPAQMLMTALATRRFGQLSMKAGLGTERPTRALVFPDETNRFLCFMPVADHPQALDVHYSDGRASMNLIKVLTLLNRTVPKGRKEFYSLNFSPSAVKVGDIQGTALVMALKKEKGKTVKTKQQRARAKARKSLRKAQSPGGDASTPPTTT